MIITSSDLKDNLGIPGKGLITSLGLNTNMRSNKRKKARYAITNVSMKNLSNIIKEFENLPYKGYVSKRTKHEPKDIYFYLARHLDKYMTRADSLNLDTKPAITETASTQQVPISRVCSMDKSE